MQDGGKAGRARLALRLLLSCLALCLALTGCTSSMDVKTLMRPPRPTGEKAGIYALLEQKAGPDFTLVYPAKGAYRSAIIMQDLCGDSRKEAIVLYRNSDKESTSVNLLFAAHADSSADGPWQDIGGFTVAAAQVDRLCFGDFNADGLQETVVGWGSSASATSAFSVFYQQNGRMQESRLEQPYSEMVAANMDGEKGDELLTVTAQIDERQTMRVSLYRMKANALELMGSNQLDTGVASIAQLRTGNVAPNQFGVLLDCVRSNSTMLSEILYWDPKLRAMAAPLYSKDGQNISLRAVQINSRDVDGDGVLEFPIANQLPGYNGSPFDDTGSQVAWTHAVANGGKLGFDTVCSMLVNSRDGYALRLPEAWSKGNITTKLGTAKRSLTVYAYEIVDVDANVTRYGQVPLLEARVFTAAEWAAQGKDYTRVMDIGKTVLGIKTFSQKSDLSISLDKIKANLEQLPQA